MNKLDIAEGKILMILKKKRIEKKGTEYPKIEGQFKTKHNVHIIEIP